MNWKLKKTREMKLCIEAQVFTLQTCVSGIQKVTGREKESERMKVHGRECMRGGKREREAEEACRLEAGSNAQERAGCVLIKR